MYVYNYLKYINNKIINLGNGTTLKCISKIQLSKIKIKIPKNKKLIEDLEPTFQQIETLQNEVKTAEELYKQYIKELSEEAIPPTLNENVENTENTIISNLTEENVKKLEEPKKKEKKVKSDTSSKTSVKALKEQCKSLGIKGYSSKKKDELIKMIKDFEES
jgi:restriction endonuclease S subunit